MAVIQSFDEDLNIQSRLVEMGILPGTSIRIIKKAPFNGPVEFKIRNYEVSLRYEDADHVLVEKWYGKIPYSKKIVKSQS